MCGQGFMLGPGLGEITAEILADNSPEYDDILTQLRPDRDFDESEILK
jgi:glycine/D-amino acid oxidase-like deaminating enzyme